MVRDVPGTPISNGWGGNQGNLGVLLYSYTLSPERGRRRMGIRLMKLSAFAEMSVRLACPPCKACCMLRALSNTTIHRLGPLYCEESVTDFEELTESPSYQHFQNLSSSVEGKATYRKRTFARSIDNSAQSASTHP